MATQTRFGSAVGTFDTMTSSSGGNKWEDVDDPVGAPDDDTTYLSRQDADGGQTFTFTAFDITSSAVAKITVTTRAREAAGNCTLNNLIYTGTQLRVGAASNLDATYSDVATDWLTNPATGVAWTEEQVEGASGTAANNLTQFGAFANSIAAGEEVRVTQTYITVEYTESGGGDPEGLLIGGKLVGLGLLGGVLT